MSATETIGDTSALAASGLNREATLKETSGSIACDGFISALSGLFGCMPITSFSQNVGLVAMTKVVNRFAIATGAVIMILAGIFPIFGSVLATLPDAVLGGCTLMMFGNIVISGLQMMGKAGFTQRNITIAALSPVSASALHRYRKSLLFSRRSSRPCLQKTALPSYLSFPSF